MNKYSRIRIPCFCQSVGQWWPRLLRSDRTGRRISVGIHQSCDRVTPRQKSSWGSYPDEVSTLSSILSRFLFPVDLNTRSGPGNQTRAPGYKAEPGVFVDLFRSGSVKISWSRIVRILTLLQWFLLQLYFYFHRWPMNFAGIRNRM